MKQRFVTLLLLVLMSLNAESQQWIIDYPSGKDEAVSLVAGDMSGEYNYSLGYKFDKTTDVTFPIAICIDKEGAYKDRLFDDFVSKGFFCFALGLGDGNLFAVARCGDDNAGEVYEKLWVAIIDPDLKVLKENYIGLEMPYVSFGLSAQALMNDNDEIVVVSQVTECVLSGSDSHYDYAFYKIGEDCDLIGCSYIENKSYYNEITDFTLIPNVGRYAVFGRGLRANGVETVFYIDDDLNYVTSDYIDNPNNYPDNIFPKFMCVSHWYDEKHFMMSAQSSATSGVNEWRPIVLKMDTGMNIVDLLDLERMDTTDYVSQFQSMTYIDSSTIYVSTFWDIRLDEELLSNTATVYLINEDLELLGKKEIDLDVSLNIMHIQPTFDDGCIIQGYIDNISYRTPIILKLEKKDFDVKAELPEDDCFSMMDVYPNPASSVLHINTKGMKGNIISIEIFDMMGRRCLDEDIVINGDTLSVDISSLEEGLYLCHLHDVNDNVIIQKFMKGIIKI